MKTNKFKELKNFVRGLVYLLPSLLLFVIFVFYPFLRTIVQSLFLSDNLGNLTSFVFLDNYKSIFTDPLYINSIKNTFIFTILTVPPTIILALLLAVLTNENIKGMTIFKTIFTSTMGISVAAGSVLWNFIFHPTVGILNRFINLFGVESQNWLANPDLAMFSISIVYIWMDLGFSYLMLSGGLKNIDKSYYESVEIVGGGFWFKLFKVTIPLLSPTLFFVFSVSLIGAFRSFGIVDMLTQGGPSGATNLMVYNLYKEAFTNFSYGAATAQGIVLFILIFAISKLQSKLTERYVVYQ